MFDLIILGGGPAGYLAGERAGHAGLNTLVIEERSLGGVCLNEGCVPSKTLLNSAKVLDYANHASAYGVNVSGKATIDQKAVIARKNDVVKFLVGGVAMQLKKNKVTVAAGHGVIKGRSADGFTVEVDGTPYEGKQLLIATGSMPAVPPIPGLKEGLASGLVLTNREILDLTEVPAELVVIGGGVIGLEMASYYNSVGAKVTVVEMLDHIGGPLDAEIAKILLGNYQKKGVAFELGAKVTEITKDGVTYEKDGKTTSVHADKILLSIGRRPVTTGFGLETLGVEVERGAIVTDAKGHTSVAGVWATGDVNGRSMLAHTAYRESEVCINTILGKKDLVRYHTIPAVIYTNPEVATCGYTEEEAKKAGIEVEVATVPFVYSGRYVAENSDIKDGICKLVMDKKYRRLVGVHMIGTYASEMIYGAALMIETQMTVEDLKEVVFPHPTVCEVIREGLFQL